MESEMNIFIQYQDITGSWYTVMSVENQDNRVIAGMHTVKNQHPDSRVRAVDENGRVIDIL
jgi:hypothetical protein